MKLLIATHGRLAEGLKSSAKIIAGDMADKITSICAYVDDTDYRETLKSYFEANKDPVLVLTDLAGGSVNQHLLANHSEDYKALIAGVNLPLVLECLFLEDVENVEKAIESASNSLMQIVENEEDDFDF